MPYKTLKSLPDWVKEMPKHAQEIWRATFNRVYEKDKDEEKAFKIANSAVKKIYKKNETGKWVKRKNSYSFPICFSEAKIAKEMEIHILPVGEWKHALYGDIKITETEIEEFVNNFDKGIRKGVTITEGHDGMQETPAVGWFKKLINKKEKGLWGIVEWTEKGRELLEQKAYKYFSPEYCTVYEDPENHKLYNNVLTGGALTNSPYFKGLKAIVMSESIILDQFKNMAEKIKDSKKEILDDEIEDEELEDEDIDEEDEEETDEDTELSEKTKAKKKVGKNSKSKKLSENFVDKLTYREPIKNLSDKVVYQVINSASDIEIEDRADFSEFKKELLRTGTWKHGASTNGILEITKDTLKSIVKNFKDKVLDNVYVPLGHPTTDDPSCNAGEVIDLAIEGESEDRLMATIDVKEKGIVEKIKSGLIKCISASLTENYSRKDNGEDVGPVLFHAALVSEPYIKGMSPFIPLSENMAGSTIVPIMNMEEPLTLQDLSIKIENMEKIIKKIELNETLEEESKDKEAKTAVETESTEVGVKAEEAEKVETKEEAPESEETETKVKEPETDKLEEEKSEVEEPKVEEPKVEESKAEEEKDEEVSLAEAEKMFATLLSEGRVTPAERGLLVPLLSSNEIIELSDDKVIKSSIQLFEYLKKQPSKFSLSEDGKISDTKTNSKKVEMSDEARRAADKIAKSLNLSEEETAEMLKEAEEIKRNR